MKIMEFITLLVTKIILKIKKFVFLEDFPRNPNFFLKGVPIDYLSKLKIKAKKISPPQIKSLRKKIADLDKDFKTGKAEFWTELRKIVVNFGYI